MQFIMNKQYKKKLNCVHICRLLQISKSFNCISSAIPRLANWVYCSRQIAWGTSAVVQKSLIYSIPLLHTLYGSKYGQHKIRFLAFISWCQRIMCVYIGIVVHHKLELATIWKTQQRIIGPAHKLVHSYVFHTTVRWTDILLCVSQLSVFTDDVW